MCAWFRLLDLFWCDPGILIHLCIAEIGSAEVGSHELGSREAGLEGGSAQVSIVEPGVFEVGPAQVGPAQIGSHEVGISEPGPAEGGPAQVGPAQVGCSEGGSTQVGPAQVGSREIDSPEAGSAQIDSAQVWSESGMLFSPGIPDCCSLFQQIKLVLIGHRVFLLPYHTTISASVDSLLASKQPQTPVHSQNASADPSPGLSAPLPLLQVGSLRLSDGEG